MQFSWIYQHELMWRKQLFTPLSTVRLQKEKANGASVKGKEMGHWGQFARKSIKSWWKNVDSHVLTKVLGMI